MGAATNWNISDTGFPENGTPRQKLGFALKHVTLVPLECHWQPWEFRVSDQCVELFANDQPAAAVLDPEGRETIVSCGVSLQYLKLALKHYGCLGRMEFFPDLDQPNLAARVYVGYNRERDAQETRLYEAMNSREANLTWPAPTPVSDATLDLLGRAVAGERGWLEFARSETSHQRLMGLVKARERTPANGIRFQNETVTRNSPGGWQRRAFAGTFFLHEQLSRWSRPLLAAKGRMVAVIPDQGDEEESVAPMGTFAVLKTKTDERHGWLAAGSTMARLILMARTMGLPCSLFNRALRQPQARAELRTTIGHKGFAQAILRFGTAQMPASLQPHSRRPATTTLTSA